MRLLPLLLCGCALLPIPRSTAHCDLREGIDPRDYCQEWRGLADNPAGDAGPAALCAAIGTDFVREPCPEPERIVGGCDVGRLGDGSHSYWWFYDTDLDGNPLTADDARSECEAAGEDFVEWFPEEED